MKFNRIEDALKHLANLLGEPVEFGGPKVPDLGHGYHLVQYRIMWNSAELPSATAAEVEAALKEGDIEHHFDDLQWEYPEWEYADQSDGILVDVLDEEGGYHHEWFYPTMFGTFYPDKACVE